MARGDEFSADDDEGELQEERQAGDEAGADQQQGRGDE
jgi:hypothetical protein